MTRLPCKRPIAEGECGCEFGDTGMRRLPALAGCQRGEITETPELALGDWHSCLSCGPIDENERGCEVGMSSTSCEAAGVNQLPPAMALYPITEPLPRARQRCAGLLPVGARADARERQGGARLPRGGRGARCRADRRDPGRRPCAEAGPGDLRAGARPHARGGSRRRARLPTRRCRRSAAPATHLFQFVATAKALGKGFGRGMKRAVAAWYDDKPVEAIAYQVIKYRSREGYDHERLLDMASSPLPKSGGGLPLPLLIRLLVTITDPRWVLPTRSSGRSAGMPRQRLRHSPDGVCASGDIERFYEAVHALHLTGDGWRLAMLRVARLPGVSEAIHAAFLRVWIETKMLPLVVGNRRVLAEALRGRLLLPKCERPIVLQGARAFERRRHIYGFSWTTRVETARHFADRWRESGIQRECLKPWRHQLPSL